MKAFCSIANIEYSADLNQPLSLALGFGPGMENPNAFHINPATIVPIRVGDFVGSVNEGGSANCEVITFCAHGNGTHTESLGHISSDRLEAYKSLKKHHFTAQVITVALTPSEEGMCISRQSIDELLLHPTEAIVIRTLPNNSPKRNEIWSGNNPPFVSLEAMQALVEAGFEHLLLDLPSVDPEQDEGRLSAHRIWWQYPENPRIHSSITEMIYVDNSIPDGLYLLNLQVPKIGSDAAPSQPVLYALTPHN